jgi:hypothetical protein
VSNAGSIALDGGTEKQSSRSSNIGSGPPHMGVSLYRGMHTATASSSGGRGGERPGRGGGGCQPSSGAPPGSHISPRCGTRLGGAARHDRGGGLSTAAQLAARKVNNPDSRDVGRRRVQTLALPGDVVEVEAA